MDNSNSPIMYQYISTLVFKELIKEKFPAPPSPDTHSGPQCLTYEEKNALNYAAGYIPRALRKQLEHSKHQLKEELILCLHELTEDDGIDRYDESQDWIKQIDRGGLKHVNFAMYSLIVAMELRLQAVLQQVPHQCYRSHNIKKDAITSIMECEKVKYHWDALSEKWEVEEARALFPMITELWVTMRGFAYVNTWVERYKQEARKCTQKSKGIRKHLI